MRTPLHCQRVAAPLLHLPVLVDMRGVPGVVCVNRILRGAGDPKRAARAWEKSLSVMETQVLMSEQVHRLEHQWADLKQTSWIFK